MTHYDNRMILPEVYLTGKRYENYPVFMMSRTEAEKKICESGSMNTIILRRSDQALRECPDLYFVVTRMENANRPSMNVIVTKTVFEECEGKLERMIRYLIPEDTLWMRLGQQEYTERDAHLGKN